MPFRFNSLLEDAGIDPAQVRLLRHHPAVGGKTLADVWRTNTAAFAEYQETQATAQRSGFARPWWASFVGTWDGRTLFVGLFEVGAPVALVGPFVAALSGISHKGGLYDRYPTTPSDHLQEYAGRLYIEWGGGASGKRAWSQRAELQNKLVTELHVDAIERPFPGLMKIALPLSGFEHAPPTWAQALAMSRGVYLLTCPRDGSLYVGSATAEGGFWSRWSEYRTNGHGGNIALVGREPSDFIVSVLEVAGSADTLDDILAAEAVWKRKLNSRSLGLNRN
jgi:hypothetical protein